ncbi:hypothetical protein SLEP1_g3317 [Rubroshorea leprosula]|uniref:Transmembrane protein n=1 Tax=Rubroshorea leprosula TaxID=152421 RepID=A0AAV5HR29_9ROSI|nr:hypothetical protein SLEP1_g3317 [Rubroshorea leprosula]
MEIHSHEVLLHVVHRLRLAVLLSSYMMVFPSMTTHHPFAIVTVVSLLHGGLHGGTQIQEEDVLKKCDYFVWHDTDFTQRAKDVIWYLYNERKKLLRENSELRKQLKHSHEEEVEQTRQRQSVSVNEGIEETATNQLVEEVGCDQLSKINKVEKRMHEMENLLEKKMQTAFCKLGCVIVALCFLNLAFINFLFW